MRVILAVTLLSLLAAPVISAADDWTYEVGLYGWLAGLEGTIGVGDKVEEPVEATFDDLVGYVDFALAGHFEARGAKTVWLADISYTGLGSERDAQVLNQPVTVKMDLDQWIFELGGGYRVSRSVDLLVAGRYYQLDTGATFESVEDEPTGAVSQGWFDVFIGGRYHTTFGEKWFASVRGDVGAGGSDFAWFGQIALGYNLSDRFGLAAAWRILSLDYNGDDGSSYFRYDVTQSGLGLGLGYRF
jgi:hypothetical protein